ncbi:unnamed protein product, partial [Ectocarpus sp. 12 AP-2014]
EARVLCISGEKKSTRIGRCAVLCVFCVHDSCMSCVLTAMLTQPAGRTRRRRQIILYFPPAGPLHAMVLYAQGRRVAHEPPWMNVSEKRRRPQAKHASGC